MCMLHVHVNTPSISSLSLLTFTTYMYNVLHVYIYVHVCSCALQTMYIYHQLYTTVQCMCNSMPCELYIYHHAISGASINTVSGLTHLLNWVEV